MTRVNMMQHREHESFATDPISALPRPKESDLNMALLAWRLPTERVLFETCKGRLIIYGPLLGVRSDLLSLVSCKGKKLV